MTRALGADNPQLIECVGLDEADSTVSPSKLMWFGR
jgi:hypothetical protein